ncbi:MAG TPA: hypothetical protein EYG79_09100 [Rhodobacteraceae bacterium]|nr:hypothetical protein [Paracoccaceae bacterium]
MCGEKLSSMNKVISLTGALLFWPMFSASAQAANQNEALIQFFAGQGCAIGPSTIIAARVDGFSPHEIDQLRDAVRSDPETIETGGWLVLSAEVCEIEMPRINNQLHVSDPEVAERISAVDAYAAEGSFGCFFHMDGIFEHLALTRGWSERKAAHEYIGMTGAALISGEFAFYSENPLATPYGFSLTTGPCAEVPNMPKIKQNHELLVRHFDALIRANAQHVVCEEGVNLYTPEFHDIANNLTNNMNRNEWVWFEIQFIAMGAGWYEGLSLGRKGTPRPPLCRYDELPRIM